jgi:preprotein translocase subunit SecE
MTLSTLLKKANQIDKVNAMAKISPVKFFKQVKQEATKVTWPTRKETLVTTLMVLILATLAAIFFVLVDQGLSFAVKFILNIL